MNINWKVRFKNPIWWAGVAAAIILPMVAAVGMQWEDMTTWGALLDVIRAAFGNPVTLVAVIVSLWNTITDPTTKGLGDSTLAMTYDKPKADDGNEGK